MIWPQGGAQEQFSIFLKNGSWAPPGDKIITANKYLKSLLPTLQNKLFDDVMGVHLRIFNF